MFEDGLEALLDDLGAEDDMVNYDRL